MDWCGSDLAKKPGIFYKDFLASGLRALQAIFFFKTED